MKHKLLYSLITFILILFFLSTTSYCAYPEIISKLTTAFKKIENWLLKLSTPAAAVAICTGIFIKKFSFGDEERIRTGKNIIRNTLFSYAFILLLDLILSAIEGLLS